MVQTTILTPITEKKYGVFQENIFLECKIIKLLIENYLQIKI